MREEKLYSIVLSVMLVVFLWVMTVCDALLNVKHMVTPTVESRFFKPVRLQVLFKVILEVTILSSSPQVWYL